VKTGDVKSFGVKVNLKKGNEKSFRDYAVNENFLGNQVAVKRVGKTFW
jgi:hypothetical protein